MQKNSFRNKLASKLPQIVFALFVLQPTMDVLSFWMGKWGMSNALTLALRMGVLAATMLLGFYMSDSKRTYYATAGVLGLLAIGHIVACVQAGYGSPFSDLTNFVRVAQMPITAICLITMIRQNEDCYKSMRYGVLANMMIILLVEVLASITGTEPHSYPDGKGIVGWFYFPNSQSAILSMLPTVAVVLVMQRKGMKSISFWATFLGGMSMLFLLGTRLAMAGMVAVGMGLAVSILIIDYTQWKKALVFAAVTVAFVAAIGSSPMVVHQEVYESIQTDRQEIIDEQVGESKLPTIDIEDENGELIIRDKQQLQEVLAPIYEKYAPEFVEIFGLEKTMEIYDYTYSVRELTGYRNKKIQFAKLLMDDSPVSARFFGVELGRFQIGNGITYDVENDFHGIYFLYGGVGLAAMIVFLGYFIWLIVWALCKNWKQYFTLEAAGWGVSLVMALLHAYFTAGILRRPNASFYLSVVLAAVYYLVKIKKYPVSAGQKEE